uniref:Uncharacterized protein n=1 Tax=Noccaea caerulescens TaxID=107243 RepID=A0A1J3GNW1_NOCCA
MRKHIRMLELWADGDYGIMRWCPCGEALNEEIVEGTKYYTCKMYKYDSFFHVRKRWDTAIGEEVVRLKEQNAEQAKKIGELSDQLEKPKNEVAQLWDTVRSQSCGCESCKAEIAKTFAV